MRMTMRIVTEERKLWTWCSFGVYPLGRACVRTRSGDPANPRFRESAGEENAAKRRRGTTNRSSVTKERLAPALAQGALELPGFGYHTRVECKTARRRTGKLATRRAGEPENRQVGDPASRRANEPENRQVGEPARQRTAD